MPIKCLKITLKISLAIVVTVKKNSNNYQEEPRAGKQGQFCPRGCLAMSGDIVN